MTNDQRGLANDQGPTTNDGLLGNHQLAAAFFLEGHGLIEGGDGALCHFVRGRLGGDALQPQAGRGHQGKERSAMLGGEADDLVGNPSNQRQQRDPDREACPERLNGNGHVDKQGTDSFFTSFLLLPNLP